MKFIIVFFSCTFLLFHMMCSAQSGSILYKIVNTFPVEGDGGWDFLTVDESTGRIFVSHGNITQVVDSGNGKLLGTIQNTKGVHGIALSQEEHKAFISCGKDSTVSIVDLTSLALLDKIKVTGANPDAILYDPYSHRVFVYNGHSANATVLDAKTNKILGTISLPGKPEVSVTDGKGKIYVNIEDRSLITVIDAINLSVENSWSVSPGEEPSGLALDNKTHRLFSVCGNKKMVVVNAMNGKVLTTLDIGDRVDGCAFDPELKRAYSSNGEGSITVVQDKGMNKYAVLTTIPTQKGAKTICLNTQTHHLYLSTAEFGDIPAPTAEVPRPRPAIVRGTFKILDVAPVK